MCVCLPVDGDCDGDEEMDGRIPSSALRRLARVWKEEGRAVFAALESVLRRSRDIVVGLAVGLVIMIMIMIVIMIVIVIAALMVLMMLTLMLIIVAGECKCHVTVVLTFSLTIAIITTTTTTKCYTTIIQQQHHHHHQQHQQQQ